MKKLPKEIVEAVKAYAELILKNPEEFSVDEAKAVDRALRSGVLEDIDRLWVRWSYNAEKYGWLTDHEMKFHPKKGYQYP